MTTVEQYRSAQVVFQSDETPTAQRAHRIPPAVPSPPPPRSNSKIKTTFPQAFRMPSEEPSQWIFTDAEVLSTPTVLDGIVPADERCRRAKGVNFIIQAGILLKLPQLTLATASVFFHRFFMRQSMAPEKGGIHHYVRVSSLSRSATSSQLAQISAPWSLPRSKSHAKLKANNPGLTFDTVEQNLAATALFLATKTEENCRKTKEIVIAVAKIAQKNPSLIIDEQSKEYWRWRDSILLYEELMLEYLTFDVVLQSPYTILYGFLQRLHIEENKQLRNVAWAFLNDSCLTMICLLMSPKDIAVGAVYFATKFSGETILDDESGNPWWEQVGGCPEKIIKAVGIMNEFWSENPLQRSENPYAQSPNSGDEDLDRTRRGGGSNDQTPVSPSSPNEIHQREGGTPIANGNKTFDHDLQNEENKLASPRNATASSTDTTTVGGADQSFNKSEESTSTPQVETSQQEPSGSSDTALKKAANEPETHESNGVSNVLSALISSAEDPVRPNPKRKSFDNAEEPTPKRTKIEATVAENSEEGELEE